MLKLICPNCKFSLDNINCCKKCGANYSSVSEIPVLLKKDISSFKQQEIAFHEKEFKNQRHSYEYITTNFSTDSWALMEFMKFFKDIPFNAYILELGAGNAQYGMVLKKKGYENIFCSDIMSTGLIDARKYSKENNLDSESSLYVFDAENIPFPDNNFDCIFLTASLHHFEDKNKVISEIERCLKPSGRAIIALEPNKWYFYTVRPMANLLKLRLIHAEGANSIADEKTKGFTLKELINICTTPKLKVIDFQRVWYLMGLLYYFEDFSERVFKKRIAIPLFLRKFARTIDKIIEKLPLVNSLSFHNTVYIEKCK